MIPHKKYMQLAINLAKKGGKKVAPNPLVGCVLVKRGQIIGKGYHKEFGGPHAETMALEQAKHKAKDSILYVTLEPCDHWGKTPPCTEQIVDAGVREVVIGMQDPNPKVNGYRILKLRGLKTRIGVLEAECKKLNEGYAHFMKKKIPLVTLKAGMTLDGKIATSQGKSKYITGRDSLKMVHKLRNDIGAIMVGSKTIMKDNPQLNTRLVKGKETTKIIIDTSLKVSPKARVMKKPETVIVACSDKAPKKKRENLEKLGVTIIATKTKKGQVDLKKVLKVLAKMGFHKVLLEGGSEINASMLRDRLVHKLMLFASPKIMGTEGLGVVGKLGVKELDKVVKIKEISSKKVGKDILIEGYL